MCMIVDVWQYIIEIPLNYRKLQTSSERMMHQTPATHRILNKEGVDVNGQEKLISTSDEHFVFVRSKKFVHSSGTTWANGTQMQFSFCFFYMSEKEDAKKVTVSLSCVLKHLTQIIQKAESELVINLDRFKTNIDEILGKIHVCVTAITGEKALLLGKLEGSKPAYWDDYNATLEKCTKLLKLLKSLDLLLVRARWAEFTDAGPENGKKNARKVAEEVAARIGDAPVHSEYI